MRCGSRILFFSCVMKDLFGNAFFLARPGRSVRYRHCGFKNSYLNSEEIYMDNDARTSTGKTSSWRFIVGMLVALVAIGTYVWQQSEAHVAMRRELRVKIGPQGSQAISLAHSCRRARRQVHCDRSRSPCEACAKPVRSSWNQRSAANHPRTSSAMSNGHSSQ